MFDVGYYLQLECELHDKSKQVLAVLAKDVYIYFCETERLNFELVLQLCTNAGALLISAIPSVPAGL